MKILVAYGTLRWSGFRTELSQAEIAMTIKIIYCIAFLHSFLDSIIKLFNIVLFGSCEAGEPALNKVVEEPERCSCTTWHNC